MERSTKPSEWLTLVANIAVIGGILLVVVQLQQNTRAIQAQTRDSITGKEMDYLELVAANPALAEAMNLGFSSGMDALEPIGQRMLGSHFHAVFREWEDSQYQYERGLFSTDEYEARRAVWRAWLTQSRGGRETWDISREWYSPGFRAAIDSILAEIES